MRVVDIRTFPEKRKNLLRSLHAAAGHSWRLVYWWMDEWRLRHGLSVPTLGWYANIKNWLDSTTPGFANSQMLVDLYQQKVVARGFDKVWPRVQQLRLEVQQASQRLASYSWHPQVREWQRTARGVLRGAAGMEAQVYVGKLKTVLEYAHIYEEILKNWNGD
jgi:hypothetical protein